MRTATERFRALFFACPIFFGPDVKKSLLHSLFQAAAKGGTANLIGPIDTPHEYFYAPDAGARRAGAGREPKAYGKWWNLGGPASLLSAISRPGLFSRWT